MILKKKIAPESKLRLQKLYNVDTTNIDDTVEKFVNEDKAIKKGIFICKENKIIGFLTYDTDDFNVSCGLSFFLIDKDYRRQGFGTLFMKTFIKLLNEKELSCVVKIENLDNIGWYNAFGFKNKDEYKNAIYYEEKHPHKFKYLYYIK
jgi:ribosomal protein S18 acetylase RimI-like enzyme